MLPLLFAPALWRAGAARAGAARDITRTLPGRAGPWLPAVLEPFISALITVLLLALAGYSWKYLQLGAISALVWHGVTFLAWAQWVSFHAGRVAGLVGGLGNGLLLSGLHGGIGGVLAMALFSFGLAGGVLRDLAGEKPAPLPVLAGGALGGALAAGAVLGLGYWLTNSVETPYWRLCGMAALAGLCLGALAGNGRWALAGLALAGAVFAALAGQETWLLPDWPEALRYALQDSVLAAGLALLSSGLYALGFVPAHRLAGVRAGILTGGLSLLLPALAIAGNSGGAWGQAALLVAAWLAGASYPWWRPALIYPFLELWHGLLWWLERRAWRHGAQTPRYLRWHAGLWEPRLPWFSLLPYLRLIQQCYPEVAPRWLETLARAGQQRAVDALRLENAVEWLRQARSIEALAQIHSRLPAMELPAPVRRFRAVSRDLAAGRADGTSAYTRRLLWHEAEDNLDRLIFDLERYRAPLGRRLRPIAAQWRACLAEALAELDDAAALSSEIHNPYVVGIPLGTRQEIFVGRHDITERIEKLLLAPSAPPVLIYGQRRTGKTSLLHNLSRLLSSRFVFAYLDFQSPRMLSGQLPTMLGGIVFAVRAALRQAGGLQSAAPDIAGEALAGNPLDAFAVWLDELEEALDGRTLILALDEFVALEDKRMEADTLHALLSLFRHIIQHRPAWRLLLAGSHQLDELRHWAGYLVNVQVLPLGFLPEAHARQLIEHPVAGFPLKYTPDAARRAYTLTCGHPALVQLLCSEIVTLKNQQAAEARLLATVEDVETSAGRALETGRFYFDDMLHNQIGAETLAVLRHLAGLGEGAGLTLDALRATFGAEIELQLLPALRRELLVHHEGVYRFSVELVRRAVAGR